MFRIPIIQYPFYKMETVLDKKLLLLTFTWNHRNSAWYMSIQDRLANVILYNVKLVNGVNLLERHNRDTLPRGILIAVRINNDSSARLGYDVNQFELQYVTEEERAAL